MKIYVWPDGSWCIADEYCETADTWRGDDYYSLVVPEDKIGDMDEDIDK
jgi:hypothetical protein